MDMIDDYISRAEYPMTREEVIDDMQMAQQTGTLFIDPEGFFVLGFSRTPGRGIPVDLFVIHGYVRPGNKALVQKWIDITKATAEYYNCRAVLFTTMRPKGFERLLKKYDCKPVPATIFRREMI